MNEFLKGLEGKFKFLLKDFIFKKNFPQKVVEVNGICSEVISANKILLLRQDRIGDLLVSVPFLRTLRQYFPTKKIDILLSYRNIVAKSCIQKYIDDIILFPKNPLERIKVIHRIKRRNYELVIDPFDNASFTSSIIINLVKPRFSLGFDKENRNVYSFVVAIPDKMEKHIVERICALLRPFGIEPDKVDKTLEYPSISGNLLPLKNKIRVGVVVAGSSKSKFWGVENLAELINLINQKYDFEIIVFATPNYKNLISFLSTRNNIYVAPFTNDFDAFVAMVSSCDYLITPDTSVVHLASAFKIPVLVFYSFISDKFGMPWFPIYTKFKAIISRRESYSDVSPEFAFQRFVELVGE
ncbi:MAG: glycosyltransferase family 9 protein [Candidatus Kapaibacteriota bacterium]